MDFRLRASFDTGNVVPHWVEARSTRIDLDYTDQLFFTPFELFFPINAKRFAHFKNKRLRIDPSVDKRELRIHSDIGSFPIVVFDGEVHIRFHLVFNFNYKLSTVIRMFWS